MRKIAALTSAVALGLGAQSAFAALDGSDIGWTSNGTNVLTSTSNSTYFTTQTGFNSQSYYNSDFAGQDADCDTALSLTGSTARKYGCRNGVSFYNLPDPATDYAAALAGGSASGTLTIGGGGTTLTGTLTILSTTDEPTGATFATVTAADGSSSTRISSSKGDGSNGYNYRTADGSPFGNAWYGVTTAGTLTFALTGSFSGGSWSITGGAVTFSDTGFMCQQGGFGGDNRGTLCSRSYTGGGFDRNGGMLSWGMDTDGGGSGVTSASAIVLKDAGGSSTIATLSGVLASLSVDGSGNVTTDSGEFRRAGGSAGGGCVDHVRWDASISKLSCGTLTSGLWALSGTTDGSTVSATVNWGGHGTAVVPVPAAVWLMGSALGLLGWIRRKTAA